MGARAASPRDGNRDSVPVLGRTAGTGILLVPRVGSKTAVADHSQKLLLEHPAVVLRRNCMAIAVIGQVFRRVVLHAGHTTIKKMDVFPVFGPISNPRAGRYSSSVQLACHQVPMKPSASHVGPFFRPSLLNIVAGEAFPFGCLFGRRASRSAIVHHESISIVSHQTVRYQNNLT
jgi:hypothetical protein